MIVTRSTGRWLPADGFLVWLWELEVFLPWRELAALEDGGRCSEELMIGSDRTWESGRMIVDRTRRPSFCRDSMMFETE